MKPRIAIAMSAGALALAAGTAVAEETRSLEQLVVEMAATPAEHAALAQYYRGKAEAARARMRRHTTMGHVYGRGKQRSKTGSVHCRNLAKRYAAMASEYEALAKLHAEEAKETK